MAPKCHCLCKCTWRYMAPKCHCLYQHTRRYKAPKCHCLYQHTRRYKAPKCHCLYQHTRRYMAPKCHCLYQHTRRYMAPKCHCLYQHTQRYMASECHCLYQHTKRYMASKCHCLYQHTKRYMAPKCLGLCKHKRRYMAAMKSRWEHFLTCLAVCWDVTICSTKFGILFWGWPLDWNLSDCLRTLSNLAATNDLYELIHKCQATNGLHELIYKCQADRKKQIHVPAALEYRSEGHGFTFHQPLTSSCPKLGLPWAQWESWDHTLAELHPFHGVALITWPTLQELQFLAQLTLGYFWQ